MTVARTLTAATSVLLALVLASCSAQGQEQREPTGVQDEDADVGRTAVDPDANETDNGTDPIDIRSPFDPDFGEQEPADNDSDLADTEDTPFVALPLTLIALAAALALTRRRP